MNVVLVHRRRWLVDSTDRGDCWCGARRQFTNRLKHDGTFSTRPGRPYRPPSTLSDAEVEERLEAAC